MVKRAILLVNVLKVVVVAAAAEIVTVSNVARKVISPENVPILGLVGVAVSCLWCLAPFDL